MKRSLLAAAILAGIAGPAWADAKADVLTMTQPMFEDQWFKVALAAQGGGGVQQPAPHNVSTVCGGASNDRWCITSFGSGEGDKELVATMQVFERRAIINKTLRAGDESRQHFTLFNDGALISSDGDRLDDKRAFIRARW